MITELLALLAAATAGVSAPGPSAGHQTLLIVALGDSTTATAIDWAPSIREVYADCLPRALAAQGISATVVNAGIGDTTTRDALARLDRDVRGHHPNLVVIQFGINDSWIDVDKGGTAPRLTRSEYRDNLRRIIGILKSDGAQVVLMTPNPMRWADPYYIKAFEEHPGLLDTRAPRGIDRLLDLYAADMCEVAHEEQLPLVDVFAAFEDYGKLPGQSIDELLLAGDGIHPSQAGQSLVCRLLTERIAGLYGAD